MVDPATGGPHTAHTTNPVPVILFGGPKGATLRGGGRLADLAPTILQLMGPGEAAGNDRGKPDRMILRAAALVLCLTAAPLAAATVYQAAKASADLNSAIEALQTADTSRDRVAALTQTIRAYGAGLAALREALRQGELRQTTLMLQFNAKRERISFW